MKDKLILSDIREGTTARTASVSIYKDTHDILKDLADRTGMTMALIANKMIRFAADYVEVDSEIEGGQ